MNKPLNHQAMLADLLLQFVIKHFDEYDSESATDLYNYWVGSVVIPSGLDISEEDHKYLFPLCESFLAGDIEMLKACRAVQAELDEQSSI